MWVLAGNPDLKTPECPQTYWDSKRKCREADPDLACDKDQYCKYTHCTCSGVIIVIIIITTALVASMVV
jgi:hypothetical protein